MPAIEELSKTAEPWLHFASAEAKQILRQLRLQLVKV